MDVQEFKQMLNYNRNIVLIHNGQRYKAKSVTEVLFYKKDKDTHWNETTTMIYYVVKAGNIYFVIEDWKGSKRYPACVDMYSFDSKDELREHLMESYLIYKDLVNNLSPLNESSLSSDSY